MRGREVGGSGRDLQREVFCIRATKKKKYSPNFSIFFSATASIIEALEHDVDVIHIVNDPVIEAHTSEMWRSINVKKISINTYLYNLTNTHTYINFQKKNFNFLNLLKK